MNLSACLAVLRERLLLLLLCLLVGGGAAATYAFTASPEYSASVQLFVSTEQRADVTEQYQGGLFTQQRVKSYAAVVASPLVLGSVIEELGLSENVATLREHVKATAPLDTVLITITVTDGNPRRAQAVAGSVSGQFTRLISSIESPQDGSASPVKVSVVQPAELPGDPIGPHRLLILLFGLAGGVGGGAALALLLAKLDTRVKTPSDASSAARAPALGSVTHDPDTSRTPLVVQAPGWSVRAESYRQLRTAVRFLGVDRTLRSITVSSASAAEGKTTTIANLALALAQAGQSVVLIDADLRRPHLTELMGLDPTVGLTTVLMADVPVREALQHFPGLPLAMLASGALPPNPSELLGSARMREVIAELTACHDIVLFDAPPLLPVTDAAVLACATDGAVLISRAGRTRREQLHSAANLLRTAGADVLGVVVNATPRRRGSYGNDSYRYGSDTASAATATTPLGAGPSPGTATEPAAVDLVEAG